MGVWGVHGVHDADGAKAVEAPTSPPRGRHVGVQEELRHSVRPGVFVTSDQLEVIRTGGSHSLC